MSGATATFGIRTFDVTINASIALLKRLFRIFSTALLHLADPIGAVSLDTKGLRLASPAAVHAQETFIHFGVVGILTQGIQYAVSVGWAWKLAVITVFGTFAGKIGSRYICRGDERTR